jgi:hypothetical protein
MLQVKQSNDAATSPSMCRATHFQPAKQKVVAIQAPVAINTEKLKIFENYVNTQAATFVAAVANPVTAIDGLNEAFWLGMDMRKESRKYLHTLPNYDKESIHYFMTNALNKIQLSEKTPKEKVVDAMQFGYEFINQVHELLYPATNLQCN